MESNLYRLWHAGHEDWINHLFNKSIGNSPKEKEIHDEIYGLKNYIVGIHDMSYQT